MNLKYDGPLSYFAFNCNLRRYTKEELALPLKFHISSYSSASCMFTVPAKLVAGAPARIYFNSAASPDLMNKGGVNLVGGFNGWSLDKFEAPMVGWCKLNPGLKVPESAWLQLISALETIIWHTAFKLCFQFQLAPLHRGACAAPGGVVLRRHPRGLRGLQLRLRLRGGALHQSSTFHLPPEIPVLSLKPHPASTGPYYTRPLFSST